MNIVKKAPEKTFMPYDIVIKVECKRDEEVLQEIASLDHSIPALVSAEQRGGTKKRITHKEVQQVIVGIQNEVWPD